MKSLSAHSHRIIGLLVAATLFSSTLLGPAGAWCNAPDVICEELKGVVLAEAGIADGAGYRSGKNAQTAAKVPSDRIRVTGVGIPPKDQNATVRREMAERAALADAERKLLQAVTGSMSGREQEPPPSTSINRKKHTRKIQGHIKGYAVAGRRELPDGTVEIDLELPLRGR